MAKIEYKTNARKQPQRSPEVEKLKAEKLEADRKLSDERKLLVQTQRKLRDLELARKNRDLVPSKIYVRLVAFALRCFTEHHRAAPTVLVRLVERVLRGKHALDDADKHALRMEFDGWMRHALTELNANINRAPVEFLKEEAA